MLVSNSSHCWLIMEQQMGDIHSTTTKSQTGATPMTQSIAPRNGLNALLTPEESVLILIDHQPFQFANLHSHQPTMIVNNLTGPTKAAKVFNGPTILTTGLADRCGKLIRVWQNDFPDHKPAAPNCI